jgi:hypothetical protein
LRGKDADKGLKEFSTCREYSLVSLEAPRLMMGFAFSEPNKQYLEAVDKDRESIG